MKVFVTAIAEDNGIHLPPGELVKAVIEAIRSLNVTNFDQRDVFVVEGGHALHLPNCHAVFKVEFAGAHPDIGRNIREGVTIKIAKEIEKVMQPPDGYFQQSHV